MPKKNEPVQRTLADILSLRLPDTMPIEAEWTDAAGYHRAPVVGAWESEGGGIVLSVGAERVVLERAE